MVFFVVQQIDGSTVTFSSFNRTDDDRKQETTIRDVVLAFRLAAGWEVKGRWKVAVFESLGTPHV